MLKYLFKRILATIPVLFIVSIVIFSIVYIIPGDPAAVILGENASQEDIQALRTRMGLDEPPIPRYFNWLDNILHGDLGASTANGTPVATMIANQIKPTLNLATFAMLLALIIALPLGMWAAYKKGTWIDQAVTVISLLGISLPSFLLGLFLIMIGAVKLRWFPVSGYVPFSEGIGAHFNALFMPAFALGFIHAALIMRITRATLLEVLNTDYIRMAKSKGVHNFVLVAKHAFKNTLVPVITIIGQSFIIALSGSTVIEAVFGIPGVGSLIVNSVSRRDYQVIQSVVLLTALLNITVNLIVDLLYGVIDPRIRLDR